MKKKKEILIIFGVLVLIVLVVGITYAAFTWASNQNKGYIELNSQCFDVVYVKGEDITGTNIKLGTSYEGNVSSEVQVSIDSDCTILGTGTLYLTTNEETTDNFLDDILHYQVLDDGEVVASGSGVINSRSKIPIYSDFEVNYDVKTLSIYLWVDTTKVTDDNFEDLINNAIYSGSVSLEVVGDRY